LLKRIYRLMLPLSYTFWIVAAFECNVTP